MYSYEIDMYRITANFIIPLLKPYEKMRSTEKKMNQTEGKKWLEILFYKAPLDKTKMMNYCDEFYSESLKHESINRFNPFDRKKTNTEFQFAINYNWVMMKLSVCQKGDINDFIALMDENMKQVERRKRIHILGMGDVGSTLALGLKILGSEVIHTLGLYDINENQSERWALEFNQIITETKIESVSISEATLFDCDVFVFCASKYVPKVEETVGDVRLIQLSYNAELISKYAKLARQKNYKGIFAIVSDPVDLLCKVVYEKSNLDENGNKDYRGLLPDQIKGFGLGVMNGRAAYFGGVSYLENGRVFGPHGRDLVVANAIEPGQYDDAYSRELTASVVGANLEVRRLGFKPYVAPAIASGAQSMLAFLKGEWHYSATYLGGTFWGAKNRWNRGSHEFENTTIPPELWPRILASYQNLEALWHTFK